ncbi:TetR/AcrR family transcriptional regulator [Neobacillus sp. DY30]|uniref:TetR/AcrR family transcriptional regulator n=1 Tax=Neobacillus sp. DY30 TaxID=3047871 RepID=UPI0024BFC669|nr:TetR/AcrR family transcriptional regulator [Neobacillus sp. DY30]WHY01212.1 TetR/AcrR family transcriptional regulator [Neobacillus sp. DY30]
MARERKFNTVELFQEAKHLLLQHGYDGFTFSLLADRMEISRAALYKYYDNKENLITDFMIYEMEDFLHDLKEIDKLEGFEQQFDFLIDVIFKKTELHELIKAAQHVMDRTEAAFTNKEKLKKLPLDMYKFLQRFILLGKDEGKLKSHIPDGLIIGFILQTVAIPNHFGIPKAEWIHSIKEIITQGMFINK